MTFETKFLWFFAGLASLLVIASIIGHVLARRATTEHGVETVENLNQRVNAWWGMVIVFFTSYLLGSHATVILSGFLPLLALRAFIT